MTEPTYFQKIKQQVREDLAFHLIVVIYGCVGLVLALWIGRPEKLQALMYAKRFTNILFLVALTILVWQAVKSLKAESPARELLTRTKAIFTPTVVSRGVLFINIAVFYGIFTSFKRMLGDIRSYSYDQILADIDEAIHGSDPWILLPHSDAFVRIIQVFYLQGWLLCLVTFSLYVIITQRREFVRQYIATFYASWILLGTIVAGAFLSAGPVYFKAVTGNDRFAPLLDRFEPTYLRASSSVNIQDRLWEDYLLDLGLLGSGISAFPSLHVAMATLWAVTAWSIHKGLFAIGLIVLALVQYSSVYLGWHYAIDGYFSMLVVVALWVAFGKLSG